MRTRCLAIAGAGPSMKSVQLQLQIWCSCITQRKRAWACTVLLKMIGVHLTCLLYVLAQKLVLSDFVKLTSDAFALTCMIFHMIRADAAEGDT
jgi:hypothetical protein